MASKGPYIPKGPGDWGINELFDSPYDGMIFRKSKRVIIEVYGTFYINSNPLAVVERVSMFTLFDDSVEVGRYCYDFEYISGLEYLGTIRGFGEIEGNDQT